MNSFLEHGRDTTVSGGQSSVASHTSAALLDVRAVAKLLGGCSTRHVYRLSDAGKMPAPVRLGALVRWSKPLLDAWLAGGCKPVRTVSTKGGN